MKPYILGIGGSTSAASTSRRALDHAILTAPEARDPAVVRKLATVAGRVL
jgi:5'-methylthioadenosine phosphorylase